MEFLEEGIDSARVAYYNLWTNNYFNGIKNEVILSAE